MAEERSLTPRDQLQNPYFSHSAPLFAGRDTVFSWLQTKLTTSTENNVPWVLHGPNRIGKTAILTQCEHRLADDAVVIYLDGETLNPATDLINVEEWFLIFGRLLQRTLYRFDIDMPLLHEAEFAENTFRAFHQLSLIHI